MYRDCIDVIRVEARHSEIWETETRARLAVIGFDLGQVVTRMEGIQGQPHINSQ